MDGNSPYINFDIFNENKLYNYTLQVNRYTKDFNLFENGFSYIPKQFTITTQNGAHKFNTELLKDSCSTIRKLLEKDPKSLQYHIDIYDKDNIMQKFEDLYQFKAVLFKISDFQIARKITETLNLTNCPPFMKPETLNQGSFYVPAQELIKMDDNNLKIYISQKDRFTILFNDKEYECNSFGVYLSEVIKEQLEKNPETDKYVYNFNEGEFDFTIIQEIFNFETIEININNMNALLKIAEDLQIKPLIPAVSEFIKSYENSIQLIDEKTAIIDTIDSLFEWLYNIKTITVEKVADNIIKSKWTKSKDDISELISFILQVVRTRFSLHPYLIDLIILIDKSTKEKCTFISCFINRLMFSLSESNLYCSFMYKLYKKGFVKMEEITDHICNDFLSPISINYDKLPKSQIEYHQLFNLVSWFYPEMMERTKLTKDQLFNLTYKDFIEKARFIYNYDIDEYMKIRDFGEPNDEITNAILHDDVDKLQSIITKCKLNVNDFIIPRNIYEVFNCEKHKQSLIECAAEYGSLKCFKYLFLNNAYINVSVLPYAVFGGNTEIIRILDQNGHNSKNVINDKDNNFIIKYYNFNLLNDPLICAIMTHQNNLFDWLFEKDDSNINTLNRIFYSILNGNVHSFISFVDKGFVDSVLNSEYLEINEMPLKTASREGFYRYMQLLKYFYKKADNAKKAYSNQDYAVNTGNFSIFKLDVSLNLTTNINLSLEIAIKREFDDIFYYIVDNLYNPVLGNVLNVWIEAAKKKTAKYFNYLESKYSLNDLLLKFEFRITIFINMLNKCCLQANFEVAHKLTEFILIHFSNPNFTIPFNNALDGHSEEICQYFIDKKVTLSISSIISNSNLVYIADGKIALNLINEIKNEEIKYTYLQNALNLALKSGNSKNTAEIFLNLVKPNFDSLINAIQSHDLDTLDLVLKYNSASSFINQTSYYGSALHYAVFEGDVKIVKRLLELPNINPNLYDKNHVTPVMVAISRFNVEILNIFIDYFGDEIQKQMWQFNDGLKKILHRLSRETSMKRKTKNLGIIFIRKNRYKIDEKEWHNFMSNNSKIVSDTISRLIKIENIDLNCHVKRYTLATYACESNDIDLLKCLIDTNKIDVNSPSPSDGNTPLMVAIDRMNIECAEMLIKNPQTNINLKNFRNRTALIMAVAHNLENIVLLLINHPKFDPEESCLSYSFYISNLKIAKILYNVKSLNINYLNSYPIKTEPMIHHNYYDNYSKDDLYDFYDLNAKKMKDVQYESILVHAVRANQLELIDMIVNHPSFDPIKSQLNEAIFTSVHDNNNEMYEYLLKFINNDVNIYNERGYSLLFHSILCSNRNFLNKILTSDTFDPQKSDIFDAFMKASYLNGFCANFKKKQEINAKIDFMDDLLNYDEQNSHLIKFNELLPNGKSFFTSINPETGNIQNLVQYFLNHGVDPNSPDRYGVYPLEYAIHCDSNDFVEALLNSNRIDITIRLKGNQTFFHLAATNNYASSIFCNRNIIDINTKDDLGETPLMKACLTYSKDILVNFFNNDDLDYKHRNNKGEDALDIVRKNYISSKDRRNYYQHINLKNGIPEEKINYFNMLSKYMSDI